VVRGQWSRRHHVWLGPLVLLHDGRCHRRRAAPLMSQLLVAPALVLLGIAAWRDVATRTIPDQVSLAIAVFGLALRCAEGWQAAAWSLAAAAVLFLLLLPCHARGLLGGGDVKLLAALAIGLPPLGSFQLVVATALFGGVLATLYLIMQRLLGEPLRTRPSATASGLRRIAAVEAWRIRRRNSMPYGVAIAIGGALVLLQARGE
jgi:prepilin peptidase CpaA